MSRMMSEYSSWHDMNALETELACRPLRLDNLPARHVGTADVADLALAQEVVERPQRFLDRRQRVGPVELVQVDPVGAQASQAILERGHDPSPRATLPFAPVVHRHAELGSEHDVLAPVTKHLAHAGLEAATLAVGVGRVEQRDAEIQRPVDHRPRGFKVDPPAKVVASETDR